MNILEIFPERDRSDLPVATFHDSAIPNTAGSKFAQASPARWLLANWAKVGYLPELHAGLYSSQPAFRLVTRIGLSLPDPYNEGSARISAV